MTQRPIDWPTVIFLGGYHLALIILLPYTLAVRGFDSGWLCISIALMYASGISITAGYHRLFSHRAYQAHPAIEALFVMLGTLACQGSVITWSCDHRKHHAHVDEEDDPYSASKGFWFSHFLWLVRRRPPVEPKLVTDLFKRPLLHNQHSYYPVWLAATNITLVALLAWWKQDWLSAVTYGLCLRLFMLHHFTWFINSLAHKWGTQNYSREHSAVDNFILSLLTFGEGYHNYHHTFSQDYRNGIKWYHFDPTKWLIWSLSKIKLAYNLRRVSESVVWRRLIDQHKAYLFERVSAALIPQREQLLQHVEATAHSLKEHIHGYVKTAQAYRLAQAGKQQRCKEQLRAELKVLRQKLRHSWQDWRNSIQEIEHRLANTRRSDALDS